VTTEANQAGDDLDAGAYIGREPERATESIPGGVQPGDERVAAYGSQPGVPGEPTDQAEPAQTDLDGFPASTDTSMQEPFAETWGDQPADAGLVVDDPVAEETSVDQGIAPAEPTPDDPGADPGDIPALGGPLSD
jgi:hypothetical protein